MAPFKSAEQYYSLNERTPEKKSSGENKEKTSGENKEKPKTGTYASAKKNDSNLDTYIKQRAAARKAGDKAAENSAQNKINKAYGKGPTNRPVTPGTPKNNKVMSNQAGETKAEKVVKTGMPENKKAVKTSEDPKTIKPSSRKNDPNEKVGKITSSNTKQKLDKGTFEEDKQATSTERQKVLSERIQAGDKKAGKKAGLKGGLKRKGNRAGKKVKKEGERQSKYAEKMSNLDLSKQKDLDKANKMNKKASMVDTKNERKKSKAELKKIILTSPEAPTTFKDFDQMDSKNANKTAGESVVRAYDNPIKYFKQAINYDIKEASNSNLTQSARNNYAKNAQHDMKSIGEMNKPMAYMKGSVKKRPSFMERMTKNSK
jgi:hypothetical protein